MQLRRRNGLESRGHAPCDIPCSATHSHLYISVYRTARPRVATAVATYTATQLQGYTPWPDDGPECPVCRNDRLHLVCIWEFARRVRRRGGGGIADEKHGPSIRIPADEFRNHKKEGHGHPHSRKPVPHLRHRDNRVESISTRFHIPVLALRIWEGADLSLYSTTVASVGMAPRTAAYSVG